VVVRMFYENPEEADVTGRDYDVAGLIDVEWIAGYTPAREATYYLCGPRSLLRALVSGLARKGIPLDHIRYEFFGPADELLAA
jgi:nitric oxide dioxygenase